MVRKSLFVCLIICFICSIAQAVSYKKRYNAETGRGDWVIDETTLPTASINWEDPATLAVQPWYKDTNDTYLTNPAHEVGIGTSAPTSKLSITSGGTVANAMSNTGNDLFVKGNIEFDGKIYGDGSLLTGISSGGTPGGSSTQIQYNAAGSFGGVDGFIYSGSALSYTGNLGLGTTVPTSKLQVGVAPSIPSGSSPLISVKGNVVIDGKIYGTDMLISGSVTRTPVITTTNITLGSSNYRVIVKSGADATLPTAVGSLGREYNVINGGTVNSYIYAATGEKINGESGYILQPGDSIVVTSNNIGWVICS